jgi:hypothetical protein
MASSDIPRFAFQALRIAGELSLFGAAERRFSAQQETAFVLSSSGRFG